MRSLLALCILIALSASADGAPRKQQSPSRQTIVRPGQAPPVIVTPGGARIYRDNSVMGGFRTDHDEPPAYNDPSKFCRCS